MKNSILIKTSLSNITLTENEILNLLGKKKLIDSILLMFIEGSNTWENGQEIEFNKKDAKDFLTYYFSQSDYSKEYIKTILDKIK